MALQLEDKKVIVAEVNGAAATALSAVLADYRGMTVSQMTRLRAKARDANVYVKVVRNTLARRAVEGTDFECLREALAGQGVSGMTVTEVKGFGRQKGQTEVYRGAEYTTNMIPKIKIEVACSGEAAPSVIEAIQTAAETGSIGDGKIFELDLVGATRIRTGETDAAAL